MPDNPQLHDLISNSLANINTTRYTPTDFLSLRNIAVGLFNAAVCLYPNEVMTRPGCNRNQFMRWMASCIKYLEIYQEDYRLLQPKNPADGHVIALIIQLITMLPIDAEEGYYQQLFDESVVHVLEEFVKVVCPYIYKYRNIQ